MGGTWAGLGPFQRPRGSDSGRTLSSDLRLLFMNVVRELNNTNDNTVLICQKQTSVSFYWFNFADTGRHCCTELSFGFLVLQWYLK